MDVVCQAVSFRAIPRVRVMRKQTRIFQPARICMDLTACRGLTRLCVCCRVVFCVVRAVAGCCPSLLSGAERQSPVCWAEADCQADGVIGLGCSQHRAQHAGQCILFIYTIELIPLSSKRLCILQYFEVSLNTRRSAEFDN